jgi:protoheme ferro-lyase
MGYRVIKAHRLPSRYHHPEEEHLVQYNLSWAALSFASLVAGAGSVGLLVLPHWKTPVAGVVTLLGFAASVWFFGVISIEYGTPLGYALGLGLALASTAGGYALASSVAERYAKSGTAPAIPEPSGHDTALLLLACAEPETYETRDTAAELRQLADEGAVELTLSVTPFLFAAQKARYRAIGGKSPARAQVRRIAERIEGLIESGLYGRVDAAWCSGAGSLAWRVAAAASDGYDSIVVVPLAVAESLEMHQAKQLLDRARPEDAGVRVAYATPLQDSESIAQLVARRISVGIGDPQTTGVALVAHGQPEVREQVNSQFDEGEVSFVNRVRVLVSEQGVSEQHIRISWAEWREPGVASTVRHLAALGCERILVSPVCFPYESSLTRLDIPLGVRQARLDPSVSVVTLSAWGDEAEVTSELIARASRARNEFEDRQL